MLKQFAFGVDYSQGLHCLEQKDRKTEIKNSRKTETKYKETKKDRMTEGQNDRMTEWKMTEWQNDRMKERQNDRMTEWQNDKITE